MSKIIHYSPRFYPLLGGVETHVDTLVKNMEEYKFIILANALPNQPPTQQYLKNTIIKRFGPIDYWRFSENTMIPWKVRLASGALSDYLRMVKKIKYLNNTDFDLIHAHETDIWNLVRIGNLLRANFIKKILEKQIKMIMKSSFSRYPSLITKHSLINPNSVYYKYELEFVEIFNNIICVEEPIYNQLSALLSENGSSRNIWYIPNSVDTNSFSYSQPIDRKCLAVGFIGRFDPVRGTGLLSQLMENLPEFIDLKIILAGNEPTIKNFISQKKIKYKKNVTLLFNVSQSDIPSFLREIEILFNPVISGNISRVTLESMAVGRPVIALESGGYPVIHGETGFLIKNDIQELLQILEYCYKNKDKLKKMGEKARKLVETEFSNKVIIPKINEFYEKLLNS